MFGEHKSCRINRIREDAHALEFCIYFSNYVLNGPIMDKSIDHMDIRGPVFKNC